MKSTLSFLFVLLTIMVSSCKKDISPSGSGANFEFKVGNKAYNWNFEPDSPNLEKGARLLKTISPNTNATIYVLNGWSRQEEIQLGCVLPTSTLTSSTYYSVTTMSDRYVPNFAVIDKLQYGSVTDDHTSVTISNISGKYASGTFTSVMHDLLTGSGEIILVEGNFNHILIQD